MIKFINQYKIEPYLADIVILISQVKNSSLKHNMINQLK